MKSVIIRKPQTHRIPSYDIVFLLAQYRATTHPHDDLALTSGQKNKESPPADAIYCPSMQ